MVAVLLQSTEAEDYKVGDATGWTSFPPGGASFYSKWAAKFTFKVNDTLGKNICIHQTAFLFLSFALNIKTKISTIWIHTPLFYVTFL